MPLKARTVQVQQNLGELAQRDPTLRFNRLYRTLCDESWLTEAWQRIRRNQGSNTPGVDGQTKTAVDEALIQRLAASLRNGTYRPTPVRRVYIPKANGKKRPLGIPTIQDRIVQSALKMLLEPIFEADFANSSHGFRQGKSCMTALQEVTQRFPRSTWVIEGDIEGCFDNIHHGRLMALLRQRLRDERLLHLIYAFLKAGHLERWNFHRTYSGTPQGGILSPLLANIFLHELDRFMETTLLANRPESKKEMRARVNPEYRRIDNQIQRVRTWYKTKKIPLGRGLFPLRFTKAKDCWVRKRVAVKLRALKKAQQSIPYSHPIQKVGYVRYADDFLVILQKHSKAEAAGVKEKIRSFLESHLHLTLSEEKTLITHPTNMVHFLGYDLASRGGRRKGLRLSIPRDATRKTITEVQKKCNVAQIEDADLFIQVSALLRGWMHYYKYANNPWTAFRWLTYKAFWLTAHHLATRNRTSIPKTLTQYQVTITKGHRNGTTLGKRIGKRLVYLDIFPPQRQSILLSLPTKLAREKDDRDTAITGSVKGRSAERAIEALEAADYRCPHCGNTQNLEVHHKGGLRGYKHSKDVQQAGRDKPVRVFCRSCHLEIGHGGSFRP